MGVSQVVRNPGGVPDQGDRGGEPEAVDRRRNLGRGLALSSDDRQMGIGHGLQNGGKCLDQQHLALLSRKTPDIHHQWA